MKALIWTLRGLLALVLALLLAASGALLYSSSVKGEDPPVLLGYAPFTVARSEMTPVLYPGDLAVLRMGPESQPGDIVAFRLEGELVLRRVVGTSEGQYITQQEAFGQPDVDLLDPARVEGVCATYLPGCGGIVSFLYTPAGLGVLVAVAALLLVVPILLDRGVPQQAGPLVDYGGYDDGDDDGFPPRRQTIRQRLEEPEPVSLPRPAPPRQAPAPSQAVRPTRPAAPAFPAAPPRAGGQQAPRAGGRYKARH